ncbi:toll/interleukin-1 receptor domain-containing protein [Umezawaea endophytica]|uniref:Toll/interleukin-1 receptor domain-containing protein n=1 Tax=Umezawaea endophytica TaxID=1654476 RepID=A0A9X2VJD7_9PSEU|nr:toll/interleukin-1 receptor domain-containing protein [Umezawaea endophytica]MCS7477597.1 toll/interleukin-1 receptor domain-containing protein [Umezawaea endophytica]
MEWDFFVSCAESDTGWGEWIAWELESGGSTTYLAVWDSAPGSNAVHRLDEAVRLSERTIAVISPAYLGEPGLGAQWHAAWAADPDGLRRGLIPVRVAPCEPAGLLRDIRCVDLVGLTREQGGRRLAEEIGRGRPRTPRSPLFP